MTVVDVLVIGALIGAATFYLDRRIKVTKEEFDAQFGQAIANLEQVPAKLDSIKADTASSLQIIEELKNNPDVPESFVGKLNQLTSLVGGVSDKATEIDDLVPSNTDGGTPPLPNPDEVDG